MPPSAPSEAEILAAGRDLAAALPPASRNPVKQLDDKAMDIASQDAELRAALFRFVDVVPACRNLDDLARHLSGFLDEVDDRPPPLEAADAHGRTRAPGRAALGAAAAAGVKHMAHRFIVGETPARRRRASCSGLWNDGVAQLGRPARRGDRHDRRRPTATPRAAARRSTRSPRSTATCPSARSLERDRPGRCRARTCRSRSSALTPLLRPDAPELRQARRRRAPARAAAPRPASSAPTCTSTWSPSTRARRSPTSCSRCCAEDEFRDGPSRRPRAPGLPARLARAAATRIVDWAHGADRAPPAASCASSRAPTGTTRSSRPASTAGRRRSSRSRPSPTATSRR